MSLKGSQQKNCCNLTASKDTTNAVGQIGGPSNNTTCLSDSKFESSIAQDHSDHAAGCQQRTSFHSISPADAKFHCTSAKKSSDNTAWQIGRSFIVNCKSTERNYHSSSTKNPTDKHTYCRNISNPRRDLVARSTVGGKCPRRVLPHPQVQMKKIIVHHAQHSKRE